MKTLVVLGSWGRDEQSYYRLRETTQKDWKLYVLSYFDLTPDGKVDKITNNILEFLKKNNIDSCTLLGHSLGGAFALSFISAHPEMVKQLVLVDSVGISNNRNFVSLFLREVFVQIQNIFLAKNLKTIYKTVCITTWEILTHPYRYWLLARYSHNLNLEKIASQITTPTVILWGDKDYLLPVSNAEKLHTLLRNSRLTILKGYTHEWILYCPKKFWEDIE